MATAVLSILAPAVSSPTAPANDTNPCWTADRRAALLLASCAAVPPAVADHRARFGNSTDRWTSHVGYRAEALEAIRMEIGDRLMMNYQEHERNEALSDAVTDAEDAFWKMRPMSIAELRLMLTTVTERDMWPNTGVPQALAADVLRLTSMEGR